MTPRRTLRIARWETTRSVGSVDRKTGVALLVVLLALGAMVPAMLATNPSPSTGLYRVGVSADSPYAPVVEQSPPLQATGADRSALRSGDVDVLITGTSVLVRDTEKGRAAATEFRDAVVAYNDRQMANERDQPAAFPVQVHLQYLQQSTPDVGTAGGTGGDSSGGGTVAGGGTGGATTEPPTTESGGATADGTGDMTGTSATSSTEASTGETNGGAPTTTASSSAGDGADTGAGGFGGGTGGLPAPPTGGVFATGQSGTPSSLSPPFPLRSLLLAFVFLLPFNVVIQAYGSTIVSERINRRGEPLLVSPASKLDIVVGKTLPYFAGAIAITGVIALAIGGGAVSVLAIAPLAALFLASTFVAGMLARSYKELTFVTVTISVGLTSYAFIPAVFADVHPIAAISPLTLVVNDLRGMAVDPGAAVLATGPVTVAAAVLFVLGVGIYREEDMFTQRPLPQKTLDALAAPLDSTWRVGLWTALFIPFVLVAELFAVAVLFALPTSLSLPLLLTAIALVEEVAKSVHVFAGFRRARFGRSGRRALALGVASGVGFFVAEKALLVTQLVGLPELELGRAAFAPAVLGISPALLLVAPLLLHVTTATVSALGALRSRAWYALGLVTAVAIHVAYNLWVVQHLA
ncbi:MAG: ABC transporter permease [Halanaeroarchaeum sp.]